MTHTILADRNRAAKASRLAVVLAEAGATSATIPHLDDDAWVIAAAAAGTREPSQATRDLVAVWLADRERPPAPEAIRNADRLLAKGREERKRDADPFAGLGLDTAYAV